MATITDLVDDVITMSKRPDARARAVILCNNIISEITSKANYGEDLIEVTVVNPGPDMSAVIPFADISNLPIRAFEYVKTNTSEKTLKAISPRNALDAVDCAFAGVFYRSGTNLVVKAEASWTELRIGFWRGMSRLSEVAGQDTHWLLDTEYDLVYMGVLARLFRATGDDDSANQHEPLYRDALQSFRLKRADSEEL